MSEEVDSWPQTDELSAEQRELFDQLLASALDDVELGQEPIAPRADAGAVPLSFAQQRLWFLHQLDPASPAYNMPSGLRLEGRLDRGALRASLADIVRRHESLRTTFQTVLGEPVQVVQPEAPVDVPRIDLRGVPALRRHEEATTLAREDAHRPFDLAAGPLLRALLVQLDGEDHVVLFTTHHIVSDGWSVGVLVREFAAHYEARCAGRPPRLPELPIQYADFAAWQRARLTDGAEVERLLAFWRGQLAGAPGQLELPTDRPRPSRQSFRGRRRAWTLSPALRGEVEAFSRARGATPFMTILAAIDAWLAAYAGQDDLVVGSPIANRTRGELEGLIGFFVNALPLRARLSGDPTFAELVTQVREVALRAYEHQELPFERLVEELQAERDLGANPVFQVMFALQNAPLAPLALAGLRVTPLAIDFETAKFDLHLELWEDASLPGAIEWSTDLFDAATVARMTAHL
ncbi:MAG TPA: condensation domain-containing protein, partial [Solirubrobacterales bacterium]|nr:condensation domain-containing protein [Solirubrobacterales bacterium]